MNLIQIVILNIILGIPVRTFVCHCQTRSTPVFVLMDLRVLTILANVWMDLIPKMEELVPKVPMVCVQWINLCVKTLEDVFLSKYTYICEYMTEKT